VKGCCIFTIAAFLKDQKKKKSTRKKCCCKPVCCYFSHGRKQGDSLFWDGLFWVFIRV